MALRQAAQEAQGQEAAAAAAALPAGTGAQLRSMQRVAAKRDAALSEAREQAIEAFPLDLAAEIELAEQAAQPAE